MRNCSDLIATCSRVSESEDLRLLGYTTLKRLLDHRGVFQKGNIALAIGRDTSYGVLLKDFLLDR